MLNSLLVSVLRITGIWKYARYRREVADIAVDDAEQRSDGRLVRRDAVEVAHSFWSILDISNCDIRQRSK